jgi:hypothetical protein
MSSTPASNTATVSPQMSYDTRSSQRSRQNNQSLSNDSAQQAAAMAGTVMQQAQTRQSPVAAATMMAQARKSPYQQVAVPRTTSRTGQRNQSRTPITDQARGYQPPPLVDTNQQQTARTSAHYDTSSHMPSGSAYNDYGRYGGTSTAANHQSAISAASATPSSMGTSYQSKTSTANQWSGSSSRNDRSYNNNSSYQTPNVHAQTSASGQNFKMRPGTQQQQRQQQQQQANYPAYSGSTHQNQQGQTSNQQQQPPSWYFRNSHNPSMHLGGQSSGFNYEPWSGV